MCWGVHLGTRMVWQSEWVCSDVFKGLGSVSFGAPGRRVWKAKGAVRARQGWHNCVQGIWEGAGSCSREPYNKRQRKLLGDVEQKVLFGRYSGGQK